MSCDGASKDLLEPFVVNEADGIFWNVQLLSLYLLSELPMASMLEHLQSDVWQSRPTASLTRAEGSI